MCPPANWKVQVSQPWTDAIYSNDFHFNTTGQLFVCYQFGHVISENWNSLLEKTLLTRNVVSCSFLNIY